MKKYSLMFIALIIVMLIPVSSLAAASDKPLIFDNANLLTSEERAKLNELANRYGAERETDFIVLTTNNEENKDVMAIMEDFYDEYAPGYDKKHGNAAILTLDMRNREVYIGGFYKAETYLDNQRVNKIRERVTADLTEGQYASAFETYIKTAYRYMGFEPNVNPDNILFNGWFQFIVSVGLAVGIVSIMVFRTGGRVTVNSKTYEDSQQSGVLDREDRYINTTVTKTKIERNNGGGGRGGGGGGGISRGGHSHSGSRGSF